PAHLEVICHPSHDRLRRARPGRLERRDDRPWKRVRPGMGSIDTMGGSGRRKSMKRSEINTILRGADQFIRQRGFYLPPFAYWTPTEWRSKGEEAREIVENQLGWDITDFGSGRFETVGLFLFTVRNGSQDEMRAKR